MIGDVVMKKAFWIYLFLTVAIMSVIFVFSAQIGEKSSAISMSMTKKVVTEEKTKDLPKKEVDEKYETVETIIRKTAHILVYTALGFCSFMTLFYSKKLNKKWVLFIISIVFCIIYASSDEIHQLFVFERSGEFRDVLIDSAGSVIGALLALFICKIKYNSKNSKGV